MLSYAFYFSSCRCLKVSSQLTNWRRHWITGYTFFGLQLRQYDCNSRTLHSKSIVHLNHYIVIYILNLSWFSRWSARYDQWWECKFIAEGIIDQGGGFRDSLADMSEELCPSSAECPMPLPFFCRTSNQVITHHHSLHVITIRPQFSVLIDLGFFFTFAGLSGCPRGQRLLRPQLVL